MNFKIPLYTMPNNFAVGTKVIRSRFERPFIASIISIVALFEVSIASFLK